MVTSEEPQVWESYVHISFCELLAWHQCSEHAEVVSVVSKFLISPPIFALFIIDLFSLDIIYIMYIKECKTHRDIKDIVNESKMEPIGNYFNRTR
jgi:hypothetical protein